jgi:hypothetical protein
MLCLNVQIVGLGPRCLHFSTPAPHATTTACTTTLPACLPLLCTACCLPAYACLLYHWMGWHGQDGHLGRLLVCFSCSLSSTHRTHTTPHIGPIYSVGQCESLCLYRRPTHPGNPTHPPPLPPAAPPWGCVLACSGRVCLGILSCLLHTCHTTTQVF